MSEKNPIDTKASVLVVDSSIDCSLQALYIELPFMDDIFDKITNGKKLRDLTYYGFKGKVESIKEIDLHYRNDDTISYIWSKKTLLFNKIGRLTLKLEGDTTISEKSLVEHYYYDSLGNFSRMKSKESSWNDIYIATLEYDALGYLIKETLRFVSGYSGEDLLYHYHVLYNYSNNYSILNLNFKPITQVFHSEEEITRFEFKFDSSGNYVRPGINIAYDSLNRPISYFVDYGCGQNSAPCVSVNITYDSRGNIREFKLDDNTVRNALWSSSEHYIAKYNEYDLLIEKTDLRKNSTNNGSHLTYKYEFDTYGNWILMKTFQDSKLLSRKERVITYYE